MADLATRFARPISRLRRMAWALFFLTLPVTSFPYLPEELGGRTLVRPLAIYPLIVLLVLIILPRLFTRPLPRTFLPLLAFVVVASISSIVAFGSGLDTYRGVSLEARFVRNLVTLGLGVAFYLTVSLLPENWADLRFSLRWLYAGFALALLWGSLQIPYVLHYSPAYFKLVNALQSLVSSRKLFATRISGMTYEPKWFAEQITFLLMPWLLGSILTRRSLFAWRWRRLPWLTVEWLLLGWSSVVLIFTFSRSGLFILGMLSFVGYWLYRNEQRRSQPQRREAPGTAAGAAPQTLAPQTLAPQTLAPQTLAPQTLAPQPSLPQSTAQPAETARPAPVAGQPPRPVGRLRRRATFLVEAFSILMVVMAVVFLAGSQNPYFSRLWRYWTEGSKVRSRSYLEFIAFEQRFVYWATALRTYSEQPVLGVGLGNYAFYFADNLPDQPYDIQKEIMRQITPGEGRDRLITPKNLYARLIAETGLAGTAVFTTFLLGVVGCMLYLWFSPCAEQRTWAMGGLLALIVFGFVIFSFDSFALPNMWVVLGLITAAAHLPDPTDA